MPMTTMLVTSPNERASMCWATISSAASERERPFAPLAQKAQPMAQPAWVEMHWVKREAAGMRTVSTASPSAKETRSFLVPSDDSETAATSQGVMGNSSLSVSRKSFGSVVAPSQSRMQSRYSDWSIWSALNARSPRSARIGFHSSGNMLQAGLVIGAYYIIISRVVGRGIFADLVSWANVRRRK